jgi:hypothetical protein
MASSAPMTQYVGKSLKQIKRPDLKKVGSIRYG